MVDQTGNQTGNTITNWIMGVLALVAIGALGWTGNRIADQTDDNTRSVQSLGQTLAVVTGTLDSLKANTEAVRQLTGIVSRSEQTIQMTFDKVEENNASVNNLRTAIAVAQGVADRTLEQVTENAALIKELDRRVDGLERVFDGLERGFDILKQRAAFAPVDVDREFALALIVTEPVEIASEKIIRQAAIYDQSVRKVHIFWRDQDGMNNRREMDRLGMKYRLLDMSAVSFLDIEVEAVPDKVEKLRVKKIDKAYSFMSYIPEDDDYGKGSPVTLKEIKGLLINSNWRPVKTINVKGSNTYRLLRDEITAYPAQFLPSLSK